MSSEFLEVALPEMDSIYFYGYLGLTFMIALWLVLKSQSKYKFELFFLSFFLMSGSISDMLTFKIPGVSFFEIQPDRFLFFLFGFFLMRNLLFPKQEIQLPIGWSVPWFKIFIYLYALLVISSQVFHVNENGMSEMITNIVYVFNFLLIMYCVRVMVDEETMRIIGSALIIGAIFASISSIVQFLIDPMFLRVGDQRIAFGTTLRSNGLFINEYLNAYFVITALAWVLITYKDGFIKYLLYGIFTLGVICAFQRMSWLILSIVTFIYFTQIKKISFSRLMAVGLAGLSIIIIIVIFFRADIMNSSLVKQRLSEPIDSRAGYYTTALTNVGKKPIFGFGGKNNDVYYYSMLLITHNRDRATGVAGDFHSGYFSTMFYYGIIAFLAFIGIVVTSISYFGNLLKTHLIFSIPFLVTLLYGVGNLTNTFLFPEYLSLLLAIHLGIGQKLKEIYIDTKGEHPLFNSTIRFNSWA
jgi:O-antigen ligase